MYVRITGLVIALATCLLAIGAPSASAKPRDRNHDRISDRWERAHHLSLRVNQARRDQDRDGMKNLAEYRARTSPRDADSDDDGVEDGDEQAGRVTAFENGLLTIDVFGTGSITGKVTEETEIECDVSDDGFPIRAFRDEDREEEDGDNDEGEHEDNDDGDSEEDDDRESDDKDCSADALQVGTIVQEADLEISSQGAVFEEIELLVD